MKEELARSADQENFWQLADGLEEVIWLATPANAEVLQVNAAYERVWLQPAAELYRNPMAWIEAVHRDDRARVAAKFAADWPTGRYQAEYRIVRPGGEVRWIRARALPFKSVSSRLAHLAQDITPVQTTAAALNRSSAWLRDVEKIGRVGSWEWDLASEAIHWSEETHRIFGWAPGEIHPTPESFFQALHPTDRERFRNALAESRQERKGFEMEHRIMRPDGSQRCVQTRARLEAEPGGQEARWIGTIEDVTERRQLEEQFRQAQKMEVIGLLAGGVAHDFNNLLTVIQGRAEVVLDDEHLPRQSAEYIQQIVDATVRASHLTRQLVTFSRSHPPRFQPVNLNSVIVGVTKLLGRVIGEHIDVRVQLADALPMVQADTGMIEQILMNLAVNARESMTKGGALILTTDSVHVDFDREARSGRSGQGPCVRLSVRDTGTGLTGPPSSGMVERLFTAKEPGKGTGLGLTAVYGLVEQLHGWIDMQTELGRGTTFNIFFAGSTEEKAAAPVLAPPGLRGGSERILVVEDDAGLRRFMCLLLQRLGYKVSDAATGVEAATLWKQAQGQFDLLLTDVAVPARVAGWDLIAQLRATAPQLRVVVITGYTKDPPGQHPPLDERMRQLAKPFAPETLAQTIRECLDGRPALP